MPPPYQQDAAANFVVRVAPHQATVPPKQYPTMPSFFAGQMVRRSLDIFHHVAIGQLHPKFTAFVDVRLRVAEFHVALRTIE